MISTTNGQPDIHIPNIFLNPEDAFPGDVGFNTINGQFR